MGRNHSACNQSKWLSNMWRLKNDIFTTGKLSNTKNRYFIRWNVLAIMAFGIKSAAGILQRAIENKLKGLQHAVVRVNNVLVWRRDDRGAVGKFLEYFIVLKGNGLRLKKDNFVFWKDEICYLVYKTGLRPISEKNMVL